MVIAPSPAEIAAAREALVAADPALARAQAQTPAFEWRSRPGGYEGLFWIIVGQQVSIASAAAVWERLFTGLGGAVTAKAVLAHDIETLRTFGLSRQKATYGHEIALAQVEGRIDLDNMGRLNDAEAIETLTAIKGVGKWTAETYLMMCEGRLDVFPGGDIAIQEAIRWADGGDVRPSEKQAYARAELWRPYRGVATHLLWGWYVGVKRGEITLDAPALGAAA